MNKETAFVYVAGFLAQRLLTLRGPWSTVRMVLLRTSTIIGYYRIYSAIIGYNNITIIGDYRL